MPRESFSKPERSDEGQRAASRCSFPNCKRLTVGPGEKADEIEHTGKTGHKISNLAEFRDAKTAVSGSLGL